MIDSLGWDAPDCERLLSMSTGSFGRNPRTLPHRQDILEEHATNSISRSVPGSARPAKALKILLAAQRGAFDTVLKAGLQRFGHSVVEASSLLETISCLSACHFDLLVTSIRLSGCSYRSIGDLCRAVRPGCKVVIATCWGRELAGRAVENQHAEFVVSSSCRFHEIEGILASIQSTICENRDES
jgi:hypothetical protein